MKAIKAKLVACSLEELKDPGSQHLINLHRVPGHSDRGRDEVPNELARKGAVTDLLQAIQGIKGPLSEIKKWVKNRILEIAK